jgi:predicted peptidase
MILEATAICDVYHTVINSMTAVSLYYHHQLRKMVTPEVKRRACRKHKEDWPLGVFLHDGYTNR